MTSPNPPLQIEGKPGYLFASTLGEGVCFVPAECIKFRHDGGAHIDNAKYVAGGWARTNANFNPTVAVHRMFARPDQRLNEIESPEAVEFIHRQLEVRSA